MLDAKWWCNPFDLCHLQDESSIPTRVTSNVKQFVWISRLLKIYLALKAVPDIFGRRKEAHIFLGSLRDVSVGKLISVRKVSSFDVTAQQKHIRDHC